MKYRILKEIPFMKVGDIVSYSPRSSSYISIFNGLENIECNRETLIKLINYGWIEEVTDSKTITINGKQFSEDTIKQALKAYVGD